MSGSAGSPTQRAKTSPYSRVSIQIARRLSARSSSSKSPTMGSVSISSRTLATSGVTRTSRAEVAYCSVRKVWAASISAGLTHASIWVLAAPPREVCSKRVKVESLNGTRSLLASAWITRPRTKRPRFVPTPAESTLPPCDLSIVSEPARSTSVSLAVRDINFLSSGSPTSRHLCSTVRVSRACEREECSLTPVAAVARFAAPLATSSKSLAVEVTRTSFAPSTYTRNGSACSRIGQAPAASRVADTAPPSKSKAFSQ
mmetsp:Transcript_146404/g.272640  ORF Transcript_146404/g.272640 Transcript_146404/m.272640 type:complete len:258 (+) Transcript_146404:2502-3275(+)